MNPQQPRLRLAYGLTPIVALLLAVGCQARPTADQLEWCAANQAKVGRVAIELGLLDTGERFTEWKLSDNDAYERACIDAFQRG